MCVVPHLPTSEAWALLSFLALHGVCSAPSLFPVARRAQPTIRLSLPALVRLLQGDFLSGLLVAPDAAILVLHNLGEHLVEIQRITAIGGPHPIPCLDRLDDRIVTGR